MNDTTLEASAPEKTATLTASDRCDSCGAQAYVHSVFEVGELFLCGHHFTKSETKITQAAQRIVDERWNIGSKRLDVSA